MQAYHDECINTCVSDRPSLIPPIAGLTLLSAQQAIQALEHIARWINIATITNPTNSLIPTDAVIMQVYQQNSEIKDYQIYLEYQVHEYKLQPSAIRIKLTNTSNKTLYCVLLNLTERFAQLLELSKVSSQEAKTFLREGWQTRIAACREAK
ncbi:MAG: hypothetical protein PUP92_11315 [Rhizonema sp. PD38]|nr:hypothetical protein [Rhizonema sp. PD38]